MPHVHRPASQTTLAFYRELLNDPAKGIEVLDVAAVGISGAVYIALLTPNGVEARIASQKWQNLYYDNYSYQIYNETSTWTEWGTECPERILNLLTPVELLYEDDNKRQAATAWRGRCWETLAKRKARPTVSKGTIIRFDPPLTFRRTKESYDTFRWLYGSTFRAVGKKGGLFIIRNWRKRSTWKILNAAEVAALNLEGEIT